MKRVLAFMTNKMKILIANQQVFQGLAAVYTISWPPALLKILEFFSIFNFELFEIFLP